METPKTYVGYDSQGNRVVSCTAANANEYINPAEVQAAIDNVSSVATEQMGLISSALSNLTSDANEAVIVQGTKMTGVIEELCGAIEGVPSSIYDKISGYYDEAMKIHDELQRKANGEAEQAAWGKEGVVSVTG